MTRNKLTNKFDTPSDALKEEVESYITKTLKGPMAFKEFHQIFEGIYFKFIKKNQSLSYQMQFNLHSLLQKIWLKASAS